MFSEILKDKKTAFLITDEKEREYFSGVQIAEGYLLLCESPAYFTDARYIEALKEKLKAAKSREVSQKKHILPVLFKDVKDLGEYLKALSVKRLYINFDKTTVTEYNAYKSLGLKISDGAEQINKLRSVKSEEEINNIKKACEITEKAFYKLIKDIKVGVTEKQLKDKLLSYYETLGSSGESFDTIVAFGKNSAVPHHETGNDVLTKDTVVLIDTGCVYNGYCSDCTRTLFFGNPPEKFINAYTAVQKANVEAEEKISAGMNTDEADAISRKVLGEFGLEEYFTHSLGHGLGLEIHEFPYLSKRRKDRLEENMAFTIEPGVYFEGEFGIRIEDTVLIQNGKIKRLFGDDKNLIVIKNS